jgi:microcin C transport system substrate-binding protein
MVVGSGESRESGITLVTDLSRRNVFRIGAGVIASNVIGSSGQAQPVADAERHGISSFGDLKYPADFPHFDYVNPQAPKGGVFSQIGPGTIYNQNTLTFNSLNSYMRRRAWN